MDPSPFRERDLDDEAEEFIVSWAQEHPLHRPIKLRVHLREPSDLVEQQMIADSIHNYFGYKFGLNSREFRRLMRQGWLSLLIGLAFLVICVIGATTLAPRLGNLQAVMREGLLIIGWVAMWRPLEIYLYRWWPVRDLGKVYRKLSEIPIEVLARPL
jgi:hypothetical protein